MPGHRHSSLGGPSRRPVAHRTPVRPSGWRRFLSGQALTSRVALLRTAMILLATGCGPRVMAAGPTLMPGEAISRARPGETVLIAPGVYHDCAVERADDVMIAGAGPGVVFSSKTCADKGILVIEGDDVTVRNLTLEHAEVPAHNGAGIRAEGGNLTVDHVRFLDNEDGILSAPNPHAVVRIRNSDFERNGKCEGDCAHGIYIGRVVELDVTDSQFFDQRIGHHIKSRALKTVLIGNRIEDGSRGTASYEVDIPSGGSLIMLDNTLEKGPRSDNPGSAVILGEEKNSGIQPTQEILIRDNRFTNANPQATIFVNNQTATPAILEGNALRGDVRPLLGPGKVMATAPLGPAATAPQRPIRPHADAPETPRTY